MWWKDSIFYLVYLPAFKDSNGDGCGDLPGLISEIPYLADLGIGAICISPFYQSQMVDNGLGIVFWGIRLGIG
ncbi:Oligo-1,6-glucosidase [subsurface metagenome]